MTLTKSMFPGPGPYVFTSGDVGVTEHEIRRSLGALYRQSDQVGSSYVLGVGMDLDIVVLVTDSADALDALDEDGYECNSKGYEVSNNMFWCLRKGLVNLMIVEDAEWYDKFVLSSEVCKALKLEQKWQRVAVHRVIMDGEDADEAVRKAKEAAP